MQTRKNADPGFHIVDKGHTRNWTQELLRHKREPYQCATLLP